MREQYEKGRERCLHMTEDEALGLLDMVMMAPGELTAEQRRVVEKVSDFCRLFLRVQEKVSVNSSPSSRTPNGVTLPGAYAA